MGDFLKSLSSFLTFLQQHVFPSFVFVVLNEFILLPALLDALSQWGIIIGSLPSDLLTKLGIAFVVALVLGYMFENSSIPITELFQGYHWRNRFYGRWLTKRQKDRKERLNKNIDDLETRFNEQINRLKEQALDYEVGGSKRERLYRQRQELKLRFDEEIAYYQEQLREGFPLSGEVMPTRLGNIIASSYDYAFQRYAIDAVTLWPRIFPLLSQKGYDIIVRQEKAKVDFFLDSCVLSIVFSFECLLIIFAGTSLWFPASAPLSLVAAYGFYRLAAIGAINWGRTIRTAFDLYRYDLLSDLYGLSPTEFEQEKILWGQFSQFIREGKATISTALDYRCVQERLRKPLEDKTIQSGVKGDKQ